MEIVVDTNVIISALLREGLTRKTLFLAPFKFYTLSNAMKFLMSGSNKGFEVFDTRSPSL